MRPLSSTVFKFREPINQEMKVFSYGVNLAGQLRGWPAAKLNFRLRRKFQGDFHFTSPSAEHVQILKHGNCP